MLKILAIGNSFSNDATAYLHQALDSAGVENRVLNLYIGGCSLKLHWTNVENNAADYAYEPNGTNPGTKISIDAALREDEWDIVTLQQASHDSGFPDTYEPYLSKLAAHVREIRPNAKLVIHQTWAYEKTAQHPRFVNYGKDQSLMYGAIIASYRRAAEIIHAPIIPCGEVIQSLRALPAFDIDNGGMAITRDGFHMNIPYGRYALAVTWYVSLCGGKADDVTFAPENTNPAILAEIRGTVDRIAGK